MSRCPASTRGTTSCGAPFLWHFALHAVPGLPEQLVTGRQRSYFDYFYDLLSATSDVPGSDVRAEQASAYSAPAALTAGFDWYRAFDQDARDNQAAASGPPASTPLPLPAWRRRAGRLNRCLCRRFPPRGRDRCPSGRGPRGRAFSPPGGCRGDLAARFPSSSPAPRHACRPPSDRKETAMTTTVIGATGRIGSAVVQRLLDAGQSVRVLVRDPGKAAQLFGGRPGCGDRSRPAGRPSGRHRRAREVRHRLPGHGFRRDRGEPSASRHPGRRVHPGSPAARAPVRAERRAGLPRHQPSAGTGASTSRPRSPACLTPRSAPPSSRRRCSPGPRRSGPPGPGPAWPAPAGSPSATPATWLTPPPASSATPRPGASTMTSPAPGWSAGPEALQVLSGELGETVTFRTTGAFELVRQLTGAGVPAGQAELLVTREWAIMAGENERVTTTVRDLTGHEPADHRGLPAREPRAVPLTGGRITGNLPGDAGHGGTRSRAAFVHHLPGRLSRPVVDAQVPLLVFVPAVAFDELAVVLRKRLGALVRPRRHARPPSAAISS